MTRRDPEVAAAILDYLISMKPTDEPADATHQVSMRVAERAIRTAIEDHPEFDSWDDFYEAAPTFKEMMEALECVSLATIVCLMDDIHLAITVGRS